MAYRKIKSRALLLILLLLISGCSAMSAPEKTAHRAFEEYRLRDFSISGRLAEGSGRAQNIRLIKSGGSCSIVFSDSGRSLTRENGRLILQDGTLRMRCAPGLYDAADRMMAFFEHPDVLMIEEAGRENGDALLCIRGRQAFLSWEALCEPNSLALRALKLYTEKAELRLICDTFTFAASA